MVDIKDNFFPIVIQRQIYQLINFEPINWQFKYKNLSHPDNNNIEKSKLQDPCICEDVSAFQHLFIPNSEKKVHSINIEDLFKKYIELNFNLQVKGITRILANFYLPTPNFLEHNYMLPHIDDNHPHHTVIYYINNSDGPTYIFNELYAQGEEITNYNKSVGKVITPKQGRAIMFNGFRYHSGSPSRSKIRQVINVNFTI